MIAEVFTDHFLRNEDSSQKFQETALIGFSMNDKILMRQSLQQWKAKTIANLADNAPTTHDL